LPAACGGSSNNPPTTSANGSGSNGSATIKAAKVSGLGTVLVDGSGRTLYVFAPDKAKKVTCTGQCAAVWPPLKARSGKPAVSGGVQASLVSSDPNPSGGSVITYNHWPLYTYVADPSAGTAHGQALNSSGGLWDVITPSGTVIKKRAGAGSSSALGGGYCLSASARIATPNGPVQVSQVRPGMVVWSTDRQGRRISVTVLRVHHAHVPSNHLMVRLRLADGRRLLVSLGHPLPNGEPVQTLAAGERFEGTRVVSSAHEVYGRPYTYDLLPAGPTHTYLANGVLLGSTLAPAGTFVPHPF
jgi:predicted lipoprotein with Yx(FWY)xxD motif